MQYEITCFVADMDGEGGSHDIADAVRRGGSAFAEYLATLGLGVFLEVRDLRRAETVQRIVCNGADPEDRVA